MPAIAEIFLKFGASWILSGAGSYFGFPAVGNALAFFLILGLCAGMPRRTKPVEVVLGLSFFLMWIGADWLRVPWLVGCRSYLAPMLLAVLAFGSLALGSPFTLPYAREQTPKEMWDNPHFHWVNRILTALWGAAFSFCALAKYWNRLSWLEVTALNSVVMLSVVYFTKWFPEWYREKIYLKSAAVQGGAD